MAKRISTLKTRVISFIRRVPKIINIFAGIISIILIYPIPHASAGWLGEFLGEKFNIASIGASAVFSIFIFVINIIIGTIVNMFIWLAIGLIKWAIEMNQTIVSEGSFANFGWGITLNFANLLIVVAIVAIAFGTMFRLNWGVKLLPKLALIALLVNFSYFIATELIVIADKITVVFLDTTNAASQWDSFARFFTTGISGDVANIIKGGEVSTEISDALGTLGSTAATAVSPLYAIAFSFIAFLTLLAIAVAFLIRYVILTILLILLPVALGLSLLPIKVGNADAWQEWKNEFLKYLFFGPAMAFFIYLAFALLDHTPTTTTAGFTTAAGSKIGNYIALIGILIGGLFMAKKIGVAGAGIVQAGVNFTGGKFQQWAQKKGVIAKNRAEQLRKEGKAGEARRAELTASMYKGKFGMAFGAQKLKEVLPKTWGGKAAEEPKLILAGKKAKDEDWSGTRINETLIKLSKTPNNPDYANLLAYAIKEDKLEKPENHLTPKIKSALNSSGKGKVYEDIEKAAVATVDSIAMLQQQDIDKAAEIIKTEVIDKTKIDKDFAKKVGVASLFKGTDVAHQEAAVKAFVMAPPEVTTLVIKAVAPKDKVKFMAMWTKAYNEYRPQGKVDPRVEKFTNTPAFKKLFE